MKSLPRRLLIVAPVMLAVILFGSLATADTTYAPQGARWAKDGSGDAGVYRMGMARTVPNQRAVMVWQELLTEAGFYVPQTGYYGPLTTAAVKRFQARNGLPITGAINYPTGKALLMPTINREARLAGIRPELLCGHLFAESRLDPSAVGPGGVDRGVAQIVERWAPGVDAWDEDAAIRYMAQRDARNVKRYGETVGPVFYNSHTRGNAWLRTGKPDPVAGAYRHRIHLGC